MAAGGMCPSLDFQIKGSREPYFATDSGSANNYVATTMAPLEGGVGVAQVLRTGSKIIFIAANANTGASTLAVNGLSAIPIKKSVSVALAANDILANQVVEVVYDGTNFQISSRSEISNFADGEVVTASGTSATLANTPNPAASLILVVDGAVLKSGAGNDYTLSGATIAFATAPRAGANIQAWYRY